MRRKRRDELALGRDPALLLRSSGHERSDQIGLGSRYLAAIANTVDDSFEEACANGTCLIR